MATLVVAQSSMSGVALAPTAAAAGGDAFFNDGYTFLYVNNGGGAPINVTVHSQAPCNQGVTHDTVVAVAAGAQEVLGFFPTDRYNDDNDLVQVTYSAVTSVTVRAVKIRGGG